MFIDFLLDRLAKSADADAVLWKDRAFSYGWLTERVRSFSERLESERIAAGTVTSIEADFSPSSLALLLALIGRGCVIVPLTSTVERQKPAFLEIAEVEMRSMITGDDELHLEARDASATHPIYAVLREKGHPGLVLFSSGTTGVAKAAVHDFTGLLEKFKVERQKLRAISFLLYDHIGGINTLLYTLSNGGCLITVQDRSADAVLATVAKHRAELLPTSPTFINLVLLSGAYERYDLSSLKTVTYGTEPMPESTLKRAHEVMPHVNLQQTYGLSELGILRSKSRSSDSLWVKVGGEGFETRIVDGLLEIKAVSAMLGYLNAPSPFTDDGWFKTGDAVEVDGEWMKILGRQSELIFVGGEKVYPADVESVIHEMPEIAEVSVFAERNPITGNIVCAKVTPVASEVVAKELAKLVKRYCAARMPSYKVPVKVLVTAERQHGSRFKKKRS